jgi:arylformamidase
MQRDRLKRALFVVPIFLIIVLFYTVSMDKKMKQIKKEVKQEMTQSRGVQLQLVLKDREGKTRWFVPGEPQSVSREIFFKDGTRSVNAFHFSPITLKTVELEGQFIGDVTRGGSCNVDTLQYIPHGLTHLETSAHILSPSVNPPTVKDIPLENLSGIVYLIDLSRRGMKKGELIPPGVIQKKLEALTLPVSMLALKTHSSMLPEDYDFSGKDFLSLAPETARVIHDYRSPNRIDCLILDLPSIDPESDGGKLAAHREYFGLPQTGHNAKDNEKRTLVELAWFANLEEGYYYAVITPPRFETHAVTTGIILHPLLEME